jgi:hypothetical protein
MGGEQAANVLATVNPKAKVGAGGRAGGRVGEWVEGWAAGPAGRASTATRKERQQANEQEEDVFMCILPRNGINRKMDD